MAEERKVDIGNEWAVHGGRHMENHSASLAGKPCFVKFGVSQTKLFRTRQEAYRTAAWLVRFADIWLTDQQEINPHTGEPDSFDDILTAIQDA